MHPPVYREHAPSPALADVVQCYWTSRTDGALAAPHVSRVLPDGCMDVIFNLGDPLLAPDSPQHALGSYVVGAMRSPLEVRSAGVVDMLGVRFRPGGAAAFVPAPAGELTDRAVALGEFWRRVPELEERLHETPPAARIRVVEEALLGRAGGAPRPDPRIAHVSGLIERSGGAVRVEALHEAVGLTRRHLERIYLERVGLTPKNACRVARVQAALERLRGGRVPSLSRLALECGWYDQSHMNRDFREIAGVPPATYARHVAFFQDRERGGE
ncbi:MAG TPA: helix-turn-helix domain-containing protein [Longimicrobium sp.]